MTMLSLPREKKVQLGRNHLHHQSGHPAYDAHLGTPVPSLCGWPPGRFTFFLSPSSLFFFFFSPCYFSLQITSTISQHMPSSMDPPNKSSCVNFSQYLSCNMGCGHCTLLAECESALAIKAKAIG